VIIQVNQIVIQLNHQPWMTKPCNTSCILLFYNRSMLFCCRNSPWFPVQIEKIDIAYHLLFLPSAQYSLHHLLHRLHPSLGSCNHKQQEATDDTDIGVDSWQVHNCTSVNILNFSRKVIHFSVVLEQIPLLQWQLFEFWWRLIDSKATQII
jgi:hypothetical protein